MTVPLIGIPVERYWTQLVSEPPLTNSLYAMYGMYPDLMVGLLMASKTSVTVKSL